VEGGDFQEAMMADINLDEVEEIRKKYPFLNDLRTDVLR
jgi:predicted amidohydrolase